MHRLQLASTPSVHLPGVGFGIVTLVSPNCGAVMRASAVRCTSSPGAAYSTADCVPSVTSLKSASTRTAAVPGGTVNDTLHSAFSSPMASRTG